MKTLCEWMPGKRGSLLIPVEPTTLSPSVMLDVEKDPGLLKELFEREQLVGGVLEDAAELWEKASARQEEQVSCDCSR